MRARELDVADEHSSPDAGRRSALRRAPLIGVAYVIAASLALPGAAPAAGLLDPVCKIVSHSPVPLAPTCSMARRGLTAGRQLAAGNTGGALGGLLGGTASDVASIALGSIAGSAASAAKFALDETATLIAATTGPRLEAPWFQRVYWRVAGISVLLTLPCLFAAAVQSLIRSDLALLARAAFGYLPAAMLAVGVCAQLTALLLSAVDGLCTLVSGAAGQAAPAFLHRAGESIVLLSAADRSPFLAFVIALFTVAGAVVLWLELMVRAAAVYVVVAMLPLAFAAFVWPARRVWATRAVELLAALILAKLAMVTVLTLGGAALTQSPNAAGFLAGLVLLVLGAFSPWAMLRMIPLSELASGAAGRLRAETGLLGAPELMAGGAAGAAHGWAASASGQLRHGVQRGAGGARTAAESVIARMVGDHSPQASQDGPGRDDDTPAADRGGEHQRQPLSSSPVQAGDVSLPAPDRDNAAPARASSMFGAPDYSWRELELSPAGGWGEAPLWPGAAPRGQHPVPPRESAEQTPAAMSREGMSPPDAPGHTESASAVPGDAGLPAPRDADLAADQRPDHDVPPAGAERPPEPGPDRNRA